MVFVNLIDIFLLNINVSKLSIHSQQFSLFMTSHDFIETNITKMTFYNFK